MFNVLKMNRVDIIVTNGTKSCNMTLIRSVIKGNDVTLNQFRCFLFICCLLGGLKSVANGPRSHSKPQTSYPVTSCLTTYHQSR